MFSQILWSISLILITAYLGFTSFLLVFQSRFIYAPFREIVATPKNMGLSYDEVWFETSDGVKINAWFVPAENARGVLIFCHGNAGNISHRLESLMIFNRLGLSTLIFDYRGYGQSEGKPTEQGTYLDAQAAWDYLVIKKGILPNGIIIFGRSLGGAIAAKLARDNTPGALIVESAFTSIPDIASGVYPIFPVKFIARFEYATEKFIRDLECPALIVHSSGDELIPFSHGEKLFELAREPKEFLEIEGGHNDGFILSGKTYFKGLNSFISKII